jgi:hypothetical protein
VNGSFSLCTCESSHAIGPDCALGAGGWQPFRASLISFAICHAISASPPSWHPDPGARSTGLEPHPQVSHTMQYNDIIRAKTRLVVTPLISTLNQRRSSLPRLSLSNLHRASLRAISRPHPSSPSLHLIPFSFLSSESLAVASGFWADCKEGFIDNRDRLETAPISAVTTPILEAGRQIDQQRKVGQTDFQG